MPAGEDPNLAESLREIGQVPERVISKAQAKRTKTALSASTQEAMELGVFGSPTFVVDGEVFWGDDRLDDAIVWALDPRA